MADDPCAPDSRLCDLMRQGFWKPTKKAKTRTRGPTVACDPCMNWHEQGKHTAPIAVRRERTRTAKTKR